MRLPAEAFVTLLLIAGPRVNGESSRRAIHETAAQFPGISRSELCRMTGLGWGTVSHHVKHMRRSGQLRVLRVGKIEHHFLADASPAHLAALQAVGGHTPLRILGLLQEERHHIQALAIHMGESPRTIRRHLTTLRSLGLVKETRHYRPSFSISKEGTGLLRQIAAPDALYQPANDLAAGLTPPTDNQ